MQKTIKVEFKLEVDENARQSDVEQWVKYKLNCDAIRVTNPLWKNPLVAIPITVKVHWPGELIQEGPG